MAILSNQQTSAGKDVEQRNTSALFMGVQTGTATVENSMAFPQKIKNGTALNFFLSRTQENLLLILVDL